MTDTFTVTLKKLFLGEQATDTGYFQRGFTIHSIEVFSWPSSSAFTFGSLGYHTEHTETAITPYTVTEGDVIEDEFERNFEVTAVQRWHVGNNERFRQIEMKENPMFPFLTGFFGFEDTDHGTVGYGFETGFERGLWAL